MNDVMSRSAKRVRRDRVWPRALLFSGVLVGAGFVGFSAVRIIEVPLAYAAQAQAGDAGSAVPALPPPAPPPKVKITFQTIPPVKAELRWGKKKLGVLNATTKGPKKPFFIERPRDSGPLDITVRAEGFIPVNTRAYTFNDNKVTVKLTAEAEKATLFGYKAEIPDGGADGGAVAGGPDGGVPPMQQPAGFGVRLPGAGPAPVGPMPPPPPLPGTPPPAPQPAN